MSRPGLIARAQARHASVKVPGTAGMLPPRRVPPDFVHNGGLLRGVASPELEWGYLGGALAGSWLAGGLLGYLIARDARGAVTGGFATSGVWELAEAFRSREQPWLAGALALSGATSLYMAYRRGK